ncbi:hypothetical protein ACFSTC_13195 [Nonomuraea ferruginea]
MEARGPMPQALVEAWQQVWKHTESGGTLDQGVHHRRGGAPPGGVDLYVAV